MKMLHLIKRSYNKLYFFLKERVYNGRLRYVLEDNHSDTLVIVFSAFSERPGYNYYRTIKNLKINKLFILDDFGYKGSYYWYENGKQGPLVLVKSLLDKIVNKGGYKSVITMGTSKGGTCAIYYGLTLGADEILAGANQYYVGSYLNTSTHLSIFKAMMGLNAGKKEKDILDAMMPNIVKEHGGCKSVIHLLYSKNEHTYDNDIKFMLEDFNKFNISYDEEIKAFTNHDEVGQFFPQFAIKHLKKYDK